MRVSVGVFDGVSVGVAVKVDVGVGVYVAVGVDVRVGSGVGDVVGAMSIFSDGIVTDKACWVALSDWQAGVMEIQKSKAMSILRGMSHSVQRLLCNLLGATVASGSVIEVNESWRWRAFG